ncbi:MAG: OFA family MFS transporter [Rhodobacteraceae bacterium]|nr:OFA family MFS transporter [Paracoccaceae bacterium]
MSASTDKGGAAVWALALGQTVVYAGSYYAFPALLPDLAAATGWSKATLALGPTLAFLIMASLTIWTGRLVDRGLGGEMLIWGPVLASVGVLGLGFAPKPGALAGGLGLLVAEPLGRRGVPRVPRATDESPVAATETGDLPVQLDRDHVGR